MQFGTCLSLGVNCTGPDDTYLLIPSSRSDTIRAELDHVTEWAARCNLSLNQKKTQEMLIRRPRERGGQEAIPGEVPGLPRVQSMIILGVVMTEHIGFEMHIKRICVQARQSMYALCIMTTHGLAGPMLHDVVRMTTVSRLLYEPFSAIRLIRRLYCSDDF